MSPDEISHGSVAIGGFSLQVGGAGGVMIQQSSAAVAEGTETLARVLEEPHPKDEGAAAAAAGTVESASDVTAKCERAVSLSKGVAEGKAFGPDQLSSEVGVLLDLLERLDRKGRHKEELRVARALTTLLMLLRRWAALLRTLRTALRAAEEIGDLDAVAWAKHEIGSLRLVAKDVKGAERDLHEAREIRERIGDRRGLAATNHNLGALCECLRQMLREEELIRPRGPRPMALRVLVLAAFFALSFGAGVLAGNSGGPGKQAEFERESGERNTGNDGGGGGEGGETGNDGNGRNPEGRPNSYPLTIAFTGDNEGVAVSGGGISCSSTCIRELPAGTKITLEVPLEEEFPIFQGFSGDCVSVTAQTCTVIMTDKRLVTAEFLVHEEGGKTPTELTKEEILKQIEAERKAAEEKRREEAAAAAAAAKRAEEELEAPVP